MSAKTQTMYAPIARHIQAAQLERTVDLAEKIADFVIGVYEWIAAPPAPAAVIINDRYTTDEASKYYTLAPR